jgi:hypothetical protein
MTTKDDETQMSLDQFRDEVLAALIECKTTTDLGIDSSN